MKKLLYSAYALPYGALCGLIICCALNIFAVIMSPFSSGADSKLLLICGGAFLFALVLLAGTVILNVISLMKVDSLKPVLIFEVVAFVITVIPSWYYCDALLKTLFS